MSRTVLRRVILTVVIVLLSYVFTSMTVWTTEGKYLFISRYLRINQHERILKGENFAPDQYRFGSYYLVENFFKYIPLPWLDENSAEISNILLADDYWDEHKSKFIDAYLPVRERERIVSDLEERIEGILDSIAGKSLLLKNALKAMVAGFNWQTYIREPDRALLLVGENLPEDFVEAIELTSEGNRVLNGHLTARFFFNCLTLALLYLFCRQYLNRFDSLAALLLFQSVMPLTSMYFGWETFQAGAYFIGGLLLILKRKEFWLLFLTVLLGCTARTDHTIFLSLIFLLFNYSRDLSAKKKLTVVVEAGTLLSTPLLFTLLTARLLYPEAEYYVDPVQWGYNLTYPWSWIYPAIFLSLPLIFLTRAKEWEFFRKTWVWIIPFLAMNYVLARPAEVRLFLPVVLYSMPLVVSGLERVFRAEESERR